MKTTSPYTPYLLLSLVTAVAATDGEALGQASVDAGVICNNTIWRDTGGNEIWCNGGHIIREGALFHWVGYDTGNTNRVPRDHSSREASHIIKVGQTYYWFSSGLVGWNSSATMYTTARNPAGPWSALQRLRTDPPSPDSFNTQHDFVLPVEGSEDTAYIYVGDRYSQWTKRGPGRNIFLPLAWESGKPILRWHQSWKMDVAAGQVSVLDKSP